MNLTHKRYDTDSERCWAVLGPNGAIEYHESLQGQALGIEIHSPKPLNNLMRDNYEPVSCHLLETGCYSDGSSLNAERLQHEYRAFYDQDVIWSELEDWYRTHLEGEQ